MKSPLKSTCGALLLIALILASIPGAAKIAAEAPAAKQDAINPSSEMPAKSDFSMPIEVEHKSSTADHSKFEQLQRNFATGPEVTEACLECHTEAAKQVHATKHWTWEFVNPNTKQRLGKKNVINNVCTATKSNQSFCSACHVG